MSNKVTVKKCEDDVYNYVVYYPDGGVRKRKYFKKKTGDDGADEWAKDKRNELTDIGSRHKAITDDERNAVYLWREILSKLPDHAQEYTLRGVVKDYAERLQARNKSIIVEVVYDSLIKKLKSKKRSEDWISTLQSRTKRFREQYGDRLAYDIGPDIIQEFLDDERMSNKSQTVKHYRQAINQIFSHAIVLHAVPTNPVEDVDAIEVEPRDIKVYTPDEVALLFSHATERLTPALALSFFGGIRRAEICRLKWANIDLDEGVVTIPATIAKNAHRRTIDMQPNLKKWLELYPKNSQCKIIHSDAVYRSELEQVRENAKFDGWVNNAGRHSFASYHLAKYKNAGLTAFDLGHSNNQLLYQHYRKLVSSKAAIKYWSILPK